MTPNDFLTKAFQQAKQSGHIFPDIAACEAALESAWGTSKLCVEANNLFGMKQHQHPVYGTLSLPTKEFLHNQWVTVTADWVQYPDWATCFGDRMDTLKRLQSAYAHYAAALAAPNQTIYIVEVSKSWSTDPDRAHKVLEIYFAHKSVLI